MDTQLELGLTVIQSPKQLTLWQIEALQSFQREVTKHLNTLHARSGICRSLHHAEGFMDATLAWLLAIACTGRSACI